MTAIVVLFILYAIFGNRKNKFSGRQWSLGKKIVLGALALGIFLDNFFSLFLLAMMLAPVIVPIVFGAFWINDINKSRKNIERHMDFYRGTFNQANDQTGQYYGYREAQNNGRVVKSTLNILPKAASKRRAIIDKFNRKYQLYLTSSQIQRIVDASYYSEEWEKEVAAMTKEYNSIYEWYQGDTGWLRAYLKVFKVQSVSSDFRQQEQICFAELDQVFSGVRLDTGMGYDQSIGAMNEKFFTEFDDVSFMIAYRFLESHGKKYNLGKSSVISADQELEELAKKYEQRPSH